MFFCYLYKKRHMKHLFLFLSLFVFNYMFSQSLSSLENEILTVFKNHKMRLNGDLVKLNYGMSNSCREHSKLMSTTGNFEHVDLSTVIGKSEIIQQNNNFMRTNKEVAKAVLDLFLTSPSHKYLLEDFSNEIGIGVYVDSEGLVWVTVRFL
jgi:uncharacterized protein YkwD